jgi:hypothetical protein
MAWCYRWGCGIRKDYAQSLELARKSAEKGSREGQHALGWLYKYGEGGVERDYVQAAALYKLSAMQNFVEAQYDLGCMYEEGQGGGSSLLPPKEKLGHCTRSLSFTSTAPVFVRTRRKPLACTGAPKQRVAL